MAAFRDHIVESLETRWALTARFAVIGDYGDRAESVPAMVNAWNPDFVITTGDNSYIRPYSADNCPFYGDFIPACNGGLPNRFFPAYGNHDDFGFNVFFDLPSTYYDVTWGDIQFFFVDSTRILDNGQDDVQMSWLQEALSTSDVLHKFVVLHHPPYSSGSRYGSQSAVQWPFEEWGADAVLAGHEHNYERLLVGSIPYFVNGVGGRNLYPFGAAIPESVVRFYGYGAMLVTVDADSVTYQFHTIYDGGRLVDELVLPPPPGPAPHVTDVFVAPSNRPTERFQIPVGSGDQLLPVPLEAVNQITIAFDQVVDVEPQDLLVRGDVLGAVNWQIFQAGVGAAGAWEATWTLVRPIEMDRVTLLLSDAVSTATGQRLDGEWLNPASMNDASGSVFPSGDGTPGGEFQFQFTVLAGDANLDGVVDTADISIVAANLGTALSATRPTGDVDRDAKVTLRDVALVQRSFGIDFRAPSIAAASAFVAEHEDRALRAHRTRRVLVRDAPSPTAAVDRLFAEEFPLRIPVRRRAVSERVCPRRAP